MQVVDYLLNGFTARSRRRRQCEHPEVRVPAHHVPNDATVRIVAARSVRLVDDDAGYVSRVEATSRQIMLDRLRRAIDHALREPADGAQFGQGASGQLDAVGLRDAGDVMARLDLLSDERACRGEKDDLSLRIPAVKVEPARRKVFRFSGPATRGGSGAKTLT